MAFLVDLFEGTPVFRFHEGERNVQTGHTRWPTVGNILSTEVLNIPVSQQPSRVLQPLQLASVNVRGNPPNETLPSRQREPGVRWTFVLV